MSKTALKSFWNLLTSDFAIFLMMIAIMLGLLLSAKLWVGEGLKQMINNVNAVVSVFEESQKDGRFALADDAIQPLPSVVFDAPAQTYTLVYVTDAGTKEFMYFSSKDIQFQKTDHEPYMIVKDHKAEIYLREKDQITRVETKSDTSTIMYPLPVPMFMGR